jgi:hypothetical protein
MSVAFDRGGGAGEQGRENNSARAKRPASANSTQNFLLAF